MSFNNMSDENVQKKVEEKREKRKEKLDGDKNERKNFKVTDGANVLWVMPGVGSTYEPLTEKLLHFGPFHECGRDNPIYDKSDGSFTEDRDFSNCYRCISAWNKWESLGKMEGAAKKKFKMDMPNHRTVMQVCDFSPFFAKDGPIVELDDVKYNEWIDVYKKLVKMDEITEDDKEGVPEDIVEAAEVSPSITFVNPSVGKKIRRAHKKKQHKMGDDPNANPSDTLLLIDRTKGSDTFKGINGEDVYQRNYEVEYIDIERSSFELGEELFSYFAEEAVDINNIEPDEDTVEERASAMHKLNDEEISQYLENNNHTFNPDLGDSEPGLEQGVEEDMPDDVEEVSGEDLERPEEFANDKELSSGLEDLKKQAEEM